MRYGKALALALSSGIVSIMSFSTTGAPVAVADATTTVPATTTTTSSTTTTSTTSTTAPTSPTATTAPPAISFSTAVGTVVGEGGEFDQPWADAVNPDNNLSLDNDEVKFNPSPGPDSALSDLVGGRADYAVSEWPLTGPMSSVLAGFVGLSADQAGQASAERLTVAYVPIAMEAVAVPVLIEPSSSCGGFGPTVMYDCAFTSPVNMSPLSLEMIFEHDQSSWDFSQLVADNNGQVFTNILAPTPYPAVMNSADASNAALTSYFLQTNASTAFQQWVEGQASQRSAGVYSGETLYNWPQKTPTAAFGNQFDESDMVQDLVPVGDDGKAVQMSEWAPRGAVTNIPWAYTFPAYSKDPVGPLPDASLQNAAGAFVPPSYAAMEAAFSHASFNSSVNNQLTFASDASDKTAYPSQMMTADYLVVPLSGLPPDKARALADYIKDLLTPANQSVICQAGYLPVVQSGLDATKCPLQPQLTAGNIGVLTSEIQAADEDVVTELGQEAVNDSPTTTTTVPSSTTTSSSTTSTSTSSTRSSSTTTSTSSTTTTVPVGITATTSAGSSFPPVVSLRPDPSKLVGPGHTEQTSRTTIGTAPAGTSTSRKLALPGPGPVAVPDSHSLSGGGPLPGALATTGSDGWRFVGAGLALLAVGETCRQVLRRRPRCDRPLLK